MSKCAHQPAVRYSSVGLTGHVSQHYKSLPVAGTIVWMAGVKGQTPPDFGSPWYLWLYRKDFRFCVLFSSGSSIPLAFIGAPMSHPMSHWEQPDTICSDNSLVAASRGSLRTVVGLWLTSPCSQGVPFRKRNTKEFWRIICTGFSAAEMSHSNQTNNCQRFRHWFCFHSWVV